MLPVSLRLLSAGAVITGAFVATVSMAYGQRNSLLD
jgi:hypothetical protein